MKRSSILFPILLVLTTLSLNAQIQVEPEVVENAESSTEGFFVQDGNRKVEALECYTFKDLIFAFDLKKEHFVSDAIVIRIKVGTETYNDTYKYEMDQDEFSALFSGKEYAYFKLFSSENMEEESKWYSTTKKLYLTRSILQHATSKKDLHDAKIIVQVLCSKITGEKETTEVHSDQLVTRKSHTWDVTDSSTFSIELKNRILIKRFKFITKGYPEAPVATGNCYE